MLNGNCGAQPFVAADYATNSTYAAGWSAGQNGGYGFGAWSMDYTGGTSDTNVSQNAMDRTSPFNPFGVAWTLYNPEGTVPDPGPPVNSPGACDNPPTGTDLSRAGRAIPNGGLQPGQTFSTVIANPADRTFYRGYTIVLSSGSDNIQYGYFGSRLEVGCFEYHSSGRWYQSGANSANQGYTGTPLFDTDTATNGMQLDVSMTGTNSYHLVMTPLGNPGIAFTYDGDLKTATTNGPINWVTYQLYNTDSDFYPALAPCGPDPTDFYIKSMTILGLNLNIQRVGTNVLLSWPSFFTNFVLVSATNLSAPVWSPVSPLPSVVNDQNVVTNSIPGAAQQFYRLSFQQ